MNIEIKYHNESLPKLKKISKGDWIDLYTDGDTVINANCFAMISLGVSMKIPEGYEAIIAPRSSAFKNFGIIQTNGIGIVDNSYSGTNDVWKFPAYATRCTSIPSGTRICQFRIQKSMGDVTFEEKETLDAEDRGGFGSTGV